MSVSRSAHVRSAIEETSITSIIYNHHDIFVRVSDTLTLAQSLWRLGDRLCNPTEESWFDSRYRQQILLSSTRPDFCGAHPTYYLIRSESSLPEGKAAEA